MIGKTELRNLIRKEKTIKVWIHKDNDLLALGLTNNVSPDGMFIKTNVLIFPKNCDFEIVFDVEDGNNTRRCRIPVKVVHRSLKGIGVKFLSPIEVDSLSYPLSDKLLSSSSSF